MQYPEICIKYVDGNPAFVLNSSDNRNTLWENALQRKNDGI